jgi:3'(2'), 5'-bisphosphate nucleotidase
MALAEALPDDPIMGEEDTAPFAGTPGLAEAVLSHVRRVRPGLSAEDVARALERCDDPGGPGRRWWTLDPVDGTKGFLRNEQYVVALALVEDGEVVLAVMGAPNLPIDGEPGADGQVGCLFVAERGAGAWQIPLARAAELAGSEAFASRALKPGPDCRALRVAAPARPSEGRYAESVEAAHSSQSAAARVAERLGIATPPLRLDSQAKYAVVGRGDASIYLRLPHGDYRENVWDHAAGWLIVTEAGGRVSDVEGRALDFTTGRRLTANRGIVTTAAAIHAPVVEAVKAALAAG